MNLRIFLYVSLTCLAATGPAWGQSTPPSPEAVIGYQSLPSKMPGTTQSGLQMSDGVVMHIGVGAEAGYDTNVFYGDTDRRGSAILRVVPFLELTNASRTGAVPPAMFFDLGASLTYREYLSSDTFIRQQRAFMPSAYGNVEFGRFQSMGFAISDSFNRTEDPPYQQAPSQDAITRDVNLAMASVRWAPGGGRLGASLSYTNTIDAFETNNLRFANSMGHLLSLDAAWKWLPKTAVVLTVSQGYYSYFNTDANGVSKPTSYPFHALVGLRGLVTSKLTVNVAVGYMNGFYQLTNRLGTSGVQGSLSATADIVYRPTLLTSFNLGYRHDIQNAILGDFYYLDGIYLNVGQAIAGRIGLGLSGRYESRSFHNVHLIATPGAMANTYIDRHDNYWQVGANLDYRMKDWTYAGIAYTLMANDAGSELMPTLDPGRVNYVKQLIFARLGITY